MADKKGKTDEELDEEFTETHSSGDSDDALNTPEDRLEADPALEPELARQREEAFEKKGGERPEGRYETT